jgi:DNA-binding MarR family transcriptional regulator
VPDERARVPTIIALFRQTARLMVDELVERLHAAGYRDTTAAHHPVFENIDPEGTRLIVLAERAGMTHQSMGELVQTLEARDYVERRTDPSDRRVRLVRLTRKGRAAARRALVEIGEIEAAWSERFKRAGFDVELHALLQAGLRERDAERGTDVD